MPCTARGVKETSKGVCMNSGQTSFGLKPLPIASWKTIDMADGPNLVTEQVPEEGVVPLVLTPAADGVDLATWGLANRDYVQSKLLRHAAILFRGFRVTVETFAACVKALSGELIQNLEESSPRRRLGSNIFTSTDYPRSQSIFPHNEWSYARIYPLKLFFYCAQPAEQGGATPLVDI